MKYKPGSDLMPEGEYDAVVMSAEDRVSQNSGKPMMEVILAVYDAQGVEFAITDYFVDAPKMQWKIRHFCESAGLDYDKGELSVEQVEQQNVRVAVRIDDDSKFGKQNKIADYLPRPTTVTVRPAPAKAAVDADIPF